MSGTSESAVGSAVPSPNTAPPGSAIGSEVSEGEDEIDEFTQEPPKKRKAPDDEEDTTGKGKGRGSEKEAKELRAVEGPVSFEFLDLGAL